MIKSREDLKEYIKRDLISAGAYPLSLKKKIIAAFQPTVWKYTILMRKMEYLNNCKRKNAIQNAIFFLAYSRYKRIGMKYGYTIPINVFGPGLCLAHIGTIVVNGNAKIGKNARIHVGVTIGNSSPQGSNHVDDNVPVIGDNVYIGPGAVIYGKIHIGNSVRIGANSVVNKDVPDNVTVAGAPAKIVSYHGSDHVVEKGEIHV